MSIVVVFVTGVKTQDQIIAEFAGLNVECTG